MVVATPEPEARYVGTSVHRLEGDLFLTGQARFVGDVSLPGTAHAIVVRSPHPRARIRRIDTARAAAASGVLAVVTAADLVGLTGPVPQFMDPANLGGRHVDIPVLAAEEVVHEGQPVAVVVAETLGDAEAAAVLVAVDYEALPAVLDADAALAPDAPRVYAAWDDNVAIRLPFGDGDVDAALAGAHGVLRAEIAVQRSAGQPVETRGYLAAWDEASQSVTLYASCQMPHPVRTTLALQLGLPESRVRVIMPRVGGSFGLKMHSHYEEGLVCLLARLVGRPVRWLETRAESLLQGAREQVHRVEVGFAADGRILGFRDRAVANVGAIGSNPGWPMTFVTGLTFPGGYAIPATDVEMTVVVTNKGPWTSARGFGKETTALVLERVIDLVARELGIDPADVRRRNFIPSDRFPYRTTGGLNIDSGDYVRALDRALEVVEYDALRAEQGQLRAEGRYLGIGIGFELTPEAAGLPGTAMSGYDTSTVKMDPGGTVTVLTGVTSPGGGNDTGIAQVVADELGVELARITVVQGDTGACPYGCGNGSGRSMVTGGGSARLAARVLREKLSVAAARMLQAGDAAGLLFGGGTVTDPATGASVPIQDVARGIYLNFFGTDAAVAPPLEATRSYSPDNIDHVPDEKGRLQVYPTYSNSLHVAVIEVDVETGAITLRRYVCVHDCGTMVNPVLVEGQMHGAIVMGLGLALSEELLYAEDGRFRTNRLKTYLVPRASDLPLLEIEHQVTPSPFTWNGSKGAGEAGVGGAQAALANAVEDALAPFGVTVSRLPLTPSAVLRLVRDARTAGTASEPVRG